MASTVFDRKRHGNQCNAVDGAVTQLLTACQSIISAKDGVIATKAAWDADVTAGTLEKASVDALMDKIKDAVPLYNAAVVYRDAHQ